MTEFEEHRFNALEGMDWFPLDGDVENLSFWQDLDFTIRSVHERTQYRHLPSIGTTAEMAYKWAV